MTFDVRVARLILKEGISVQGGVRVFLLGQGLLRAALMARTVQVHDRTVLPRANNRIAVKLRLHTWGLFVQPRLDRQNNVHPPERYGTDFISTRIPCTWTYETLHKIGVRHAACYKRAVSMKERAKQTTEKGRKPRNGNGGRECVGNRWL